MAGEKIQEDDIEEMFADADYAFIIAKKDKQIIIKPLSDPEQLSMDEIDQACSTVRRNIATQQTAVAVQQAMMQAALQSQQQTAGNRTEGGLIVPDDVKV